MQEAHAKPAAVLVDPTDWLVVGTLPEFFVHTSLAPEELIIRLFERRNFAEVGPRHATCVSSILLETTLCRGVFHGIPERPLPEGDYIVMVSCGPVEDNLSVSGVLVRSSEDHWPVVFQRSAAGWSTSHQRREKLDGATVRRVLRRPTFSFTTTVYNTEPWYLRQLADCVKAQSCTDFEWVLLNNGSTSPETQKELQLIANGESRIRLFTVPSNLHIIGGNRYILERARGLYILPVDSDDLVYPYALEVIKSYIKRYCFPDLLYSDEQKVSINGTPREYVWRQEWSRLYALSTCPASHLMAFKRRTALRVKAYTGGYAHGSHDWDTTLRIDEIQPKVVHIPGVLYGWRMHASSTSLNEQSKDSVLDSQLAVVREALVRRGLAEDFEVEKASRERGYYYLVSRRRHIEPVVVNIVLPEIERGDEEHLSHNLQMVDHPNCWVQVHLRRPGACPRTLSRIATLGPRRAKACEFVYYDEERQLLQNLVSSPSAYAGASPQHLAILYNRIKITDPEWIWDALATFELDDTVGIVGGRIESMAGDVLHIGYVAGLGGFFSSPQPSHSHGFHGAADCIRRCVTAVYGSFVIVQSQVFRLVQPPLRFDTVQGAGGVEFCSRARVAGFKTAYEPRMKGKACFTMFSTVIDPALETEIAKKSGSAILQDRYYSRICSTDPQAYGKVRPPDEIIADSRRSAAIGVQP